MAYVTLSAQFETASGAWKKPKKVNGHNHGNYVISQHRVAPTQNPNCNRAYAPTGQTFERTSPLSQKELDIRARFTAVAAMVIARKMDLTKIQADQAAFIAQKDRADGKKTMKAWYWMVCGQEYDQQNQG